MDEYAGKVLHRGIAIGKIHFLQDQTKDGRISADMKQAEDPVLEDERFMAAKAQAALELDELKKQAAGAAGAKNGEIFGAHMVMLNDEDFITSVRDMIRKKGVKAEYAVEASADHYAGLLKQMKDEYIRQRASDLLDVAARLRRILSGEKRTVSVSGPAIITAGDLLPSDTMILGRRSVLAFLTREGSPLSHTAILARGMDIPALCGIPVSPSWDGHRAIVDAEDGRFILDPDEETLSSMMKKQALSAEKRKQYESMRGLESVTTDGKPIRLDANIGSLDDLPSVLSYDAEGIGLFRTDYLYMGRNDLPGEEEQFEVYREAAVRMNGRPVAIRTLDLGTDKYPGLGDPGPEKNPALGFRGIRLFLTHEDLFRTQLRAIYRASVWGNLSILFPMVTSPREIKEVKSIIGKVTDQLTAEGLPWKRCPLGIIIETPASVILADELAQEVDFFSIGTNDLTQYTLAMDRQNGNLDSYYDPYSEAVMREIAYTVKSGHRWGCHVGICGEIAADTSMTDRLLKMGVDELSVSPHMIFPVRDAIRKACTDPAPAKS